ncbi:hypothetical protein CAP35_07855 [Chitinophagaceae bacterium IBVUCB1]|nr:hypothetical protein CAP35_07855 [Chitinophagaceae bacterium IBVUCB1]
MSASSYDADAQFLKKLFGGGKKTQKKTEPVKKKPSTVVKPKPKPVVKKPEPDYPPTEMKSKYRIDVFAHLYLDELVKDGKPVFKGKLPDKATAGLDFYEGVKLAADTLNKQGYNVAIYIHDIVNAQHTPATLIGNKSLDSSDLIIGAVNTSYVKVLADYAAKRNINFVSALSPSDAGVKNNPYFILLQPTLQSHCEWIMTAIARKHKNQTPLLLYRTNVPVDSNAFAYLNVTDGMANKMLCNTMPTKEKLKPYLDSTRNNLLIVSVLDAAFAESLLQQLNDWFPAYNFSIYGMPTWKSLSSLKKPEAYPNIALHITAAYYFDVSTGVGQAVANGYKRDVGGSKPSDMVFRGYETMYWYTYLLYKYGTIFNEKFSDNGAAPFTRFDVKLKKDKNDKLLYQENKHIILYRYQSSSFMVEQ